MNDLTLFLFVILLLLLGYLFALVYLRHTYFARRNLPSPPLSSFISGHLGKLWLTTSYSGQLHEWTKQLNAPIYGLFEGFCPLYVSSDVDFLQEVFIKQFTKFNSRRRTFLAHLIGMDRANLSTVEAASWKRLRTVFNPAFSESKLRSLVPKFDECVAAFMSQLDKVENNAPINIYLKYKQFSMDVICRCAFGMDNTGVQSDINNMFLEKANEVFIKNIELIPLGRLCRLVPQLGRVCAWLFHVMRRLHLTAMPANLWLVENIEQLVHTRLENMTKTDGKKHRVDLLELMINAAQGDQPQWSKDEMLTNVLVVLIAGYSTVASTLTNCAYILAMYPDIQAKVYDELLEHQESDDPISNYDVLSKLTYMGMFVREVLRMHPTSIQVTNRVCLEDTEVCGHKIAKGSYIQPDILTLHFNPDLWGPQPVHDFCPERHLIKRHPLAFMSFGAGPRSCVGTRFALLEIKMCLARLLYKYKIHPMNDKYGEPLISKESVQIMPQNVNITLEKRRPDE